MASSERDIAWIEEDVDNLFALLCKDLGLDLNLHNSSGGHPTASRVVNMNDSKRYSRVVSMQSNSVLLWELVVENIVHILPLVIVNVNVHVDGNERTCVGESVSADQAVVPVTVPDNTNDYMSVSTLLVLLLCDR